MHGCRYGEHYRENGENRAVSIPCTGITTYSHAQIPSAVTDNSAIPLDTASILTSAWLQVRRALPGERREQGGIYTMHWYHHIQSCPNTICCYRQQRHST